jgi:undecaprenyl-diphosphatase
VTWRDAIVAFDDAAGAAVDGIRSPALDGFVYRLSSAADHSLLWHFAGVARAVARRGDAAGAARFATAMGLESVLTNGVIKSLFRRVRPVAYDELDFRHGLRRPITSSFPSGHATSAFCAAVLLDGGPVLFGAAALVGASRVYVRLHKASDVVAGATLGIALGLVMRPFVRGRE